MRMVNLNTHITTEFHNSFDVILHIFNNFEKLEQIDER